MIEWLVKKSKTYREIETLCENLNLENERKESKFRLVKEERDVLKEEKIQLEKDIEELLIQLKEKEEARRVLACRVGGLNKGKLNYDIKVHNLKKQLKDAWYDLKARDKLLQKRDEELKEANRKIVFLKNCKRAPSLEEIKDYTLRRKRKIN